MKPLITRKELAKQTRTSINYWATLASNKTGPSYSRLGRAVTYEEEDAQAWIKKNTVTFGEKQAKKNTKLGRPRKKRSFGKT